MARFYSIQDNGRIRLLKTVTTPAQAKKRIKKGRIVVPSVTTALGIAPNDQLARWREAKCIELARIHPNKDPSAISDMAWGVANHPDGYSIPSRDFGTLLHGQLEEANNQLAHGADYRNDTWDKWVQPWLRYCDENRIQPLFTEKLVGCKSTGAAGTIDLIAERDGETEIFDFKCRGGGGDIKNRKYDKDAQQLALYAEMLFLPMVTDFISRINTVIIDPATADLYVHRWTKKKQEREFRRALATVDYYWSYFLKE